MTSAESSLHNIQVLYDPAITKPDVWYMPGGRAALRYKSHQEFYATVSDLGAEMIADTGEQSQYQALFEDNPRAYTMFYTGACADAALAELPHTVPGFGMPSKVSYAHPAADQLDDMLPYVLVFDEEQNGNGKYLIESKEQHDKARSYYREKEDSFPGELGRVVAKEFIETPSNHYTSYRLVTTATGDIMAAGLLYSSYMKQQCKKVAEDYMGRPMQDSPFHLEARDIRSNVNQGGRIIPLMGENRLPPTNQEKEILEAHGINPENPGVPEKLAVINRGVVQNYSRLTGLYFGIDYIGDNYFLESNLGPGLATYAVCHNFGRPLEDYGQVYSTINEAIISGLKTAAKAADRRLSSEA